jgi:hypothetical protein
MTRSTNPKREVPQRVPDAAEWRPAASAQHRGKKKPRPTKRFAWSDGVCLCTPRDSNPEPID